MLVNQASQQRLIILDPGLRELGGHHPATLLAVADALRNNEQVSIELLCHQDCPTAFTENLNSKVKVTHHFTTDFYQYFYQLPSYQELQQYCSRLALEYISAIRLCLSTNKKEQKIVFWCHTLNWQHAKALALALDVLKQNHGAEYVAKTTIIVGLMYSPLDSTQNIKRKMHYELAFRHLAKHDSIQFFSIDYELQIIYTKLLNMEVDIQPCLLLGDERYSAEERKNNTASSKNHGNANCRRKCILYTGDAKLNKGFASLPLITERLAKSKPNYDFFIQYSITNESKLLRDIAKELERVAEKYKNVIIENRFIEHNDLMELFKSSDTIFFNYDSETYKLQSSGVLWLAAYHGLRIISMTKNWIERESARLNLEYQYSDDVNGIAKCLDASKHCNQQKKDNNHNSTEDALTYKKKLFEPIGDWVEKMFLETTYKP